MVGGIQVRQGCVFDGRATVGANRPGTRQCLGPTNKTVDLLDRRILPLAAGLIVLLWNRDLDHGERLAASPWIGIGGGGMLFLPRVARWERNRVEKVEHPWS